MYRTVLLRYLRKESILLIYALLIPALVCLWSNRDVLVQADADDTQQHLVQRPYSRILHLEMAEIGASSDEAIRDWAESSATLDDVKTAKDLRPEAGPPSPSSEGDSATFTVYLPLIAASAQGNIAEGQISAADIEPNRLFHSMVNQVISTTVTQYVGDLSGEWPVEVGGAPYTITTRYTDSGEPISKAVQFVGEHLASLGLDVEYHTWQENRPPNVIGELPGLTSPDDIFILCAHLDDQPSGPVAPGADDNASGVAAVLIAADILTQYQWGSTLRFILWTGEEQGLLGSRAYVQRAYNDGENLLGVLVLDQIGYNTIDSSPDIDLNADVTISPTVDLAQLFADVVDSYDLDLIPEIKTDGTGSSDHRSFWNYGYPAIQGIEDRADFTPYYHTANDLLATLDIEYLTEFVKAVVGTFAHMSDSIIPAEIGYLDGYITAASGGDPIADAKVTATDSGGYNFFATTSSTGYYTRSLLLETYTVTASAYGYLPSTITDVIVLTDTVITRDFTLDTASTYVVSGTVTSADRGWSLPAHITIRGDPVDPPLPLNDLWTDPITGYYSVTLAEGIAYNFRVEADHHLPQDNIVGPLVANKTRNFALQPDFGQRCPPGYTPGSIFYDGFESGDLGSDWSIYTTASGRVRIDTTYPYTGSYSVLLDSTGGGSHAGIILEQDLMAYGNVKLNFWWHEFSDEHHSADGVFISDDYGDSWCQVLSFCGDFPTFRNDTVDIAAEAMAYGLTLNDHFQIKFQFYDNAPIPADGYTIDEVDLSTCVPYAAGRVAGYVTDGNTGLPLVGAEVNSDGGQSVVTDMDGFYELVETPGLHVYTTTKTGGYVPEVQTPTVVQSDIIQQNFYLPAGMAVVDPIPISLTVSLGHGLSVTLLLTVSNVGGADLGFEFQEEGGDVLWLFEDPISGTVGADGSQPVKITFDATAPVVTQVGEYYAMLHLSNDSPYDTIDVPVTMTVFAPDLVISKGGPATALAGDTITYTIVYTNGGNATAWDVQINDTLPASVTASVPTAWSVGDVVSGTGDTIEFTATLDGGLVVGTLLENQVTITSTNVDLYPVDNSALFTTTVLAPPLAGFTSSTPDYLGQTTHFTNTTTGFPAPVYEWRFGDGVTSTLEHPTHTYQTVGSYSVTLTATNSFGSDISVGSIEIVDVPPVAGFESNAPVVLSETVAFTNTSNGTNLAFLWDFGDGITSTLESPTHTYQAEGTYTVTLTASNSAGSDDISRPVEVTLPPPEPVWDKEVYVNAVLTSTFPATVVAGDAVKVVNRVWITHVRDVTFTLVATWSASLDLTGWASDTGSTTLADHTLRWEVADIPPNAWRVITETFHVLTGTWDTDAITESLWVENADPQPADWVVPFNHPYYGVVVTPPTGAQLGDPGATVTYTLVVTNTGNVADVFSVGVSGNVWATDAPSSVGPLGVGEGADVAVTVEIPVDADGGEEDTVVVIVISQGDGDTWGSSVLTTTANVVHGVVVAPAADAETGDPGATVTYTMFVTNTGNVADVFSVGVSGNVWATDAPSSVGPLGVDEGAEVQVTVEVPVGAGGGEEDTVVVNVTSQGHGVAWDSSVLTTTANVVYSVVVTPPTSAQTGDPGATVTYTLRVTNTGNVSDVFDVDVGGNVWATNAPSSVGPLPMSESADVAVTVEIPVDAGGGEEDTMVVTVTSQGDGVIRNNSVLTTTANVVYGVVVVPPTDRNAGNLGAMVTYTLRVTNTGNVSDVFDVDVSGNVWATDAPSSVGPLPMGGSAEVVVTVEIPPDAGGGEKDAATVTFASQVDGSTWDGSVLTTTAGVVHGVVMAPPADAQSGHPGTTVTHTLRVTNTGNVADVFSVGVSGNVWATDAPSSVGPLGVDEGAEVQVTVEIPVGAGGGEEDTVVVTVTSQGDGDTWDSSVLTATANVVHGVVVAPAADAETGDPGTTVTYTLVATNTGNVADVFSVGVSGNVWATEAPSSVGPLPMNESADVAVAVEIPVDAGGGEEDTVVVTVTSQGDGVTWDSSVLTTVEAMSCIEVESAVLSLITGGDIYPDTALEFSADIRPETATIPYSYTVEYGDGVSMTTDSETNPLALTHAYAATGTHTVEIAVWNCGMTIPFTGTVMVNITAPKFWVYLPVVIKDDYWSSQVFRMKPSSALCRLETYSERH